MEILQLEYFLKVAEKCNISRSAKELYVSQPALSAAIARLEEDLGFRLFSRSANRIALTRSGALFYDYTKEALSHLEEGIKKAKEISADEERTHITIATNFGVTVIVASDYQKLDPDVKIEVVKCPDRKSVEDAVNTGSADIGLTLRPALGKHLTNTILMRSRWFAAVSRSFETDRKYLSLKEVEQLPLFCSSIGETRHEVMHAFNRAGLNASVIELDERSILFDAAQKGLGAAICMPMLALERNELIRFLPIDGLMEEGRVILICKEDSGENPHLAGLISFIKDRYRKNEAAIQDMLREALPESV